MNFLKKNVRTIIGFIFGLILASGITVYATSYFARDISYTKPGTVTAISVEEALNNLYENKENCKAYQFTHDAKTQFNYDFGFIPSSFLAFMKLSDGTYVTISLNTTSNSLFATASNGASSLSSCFSMDSTKLVSTIPTDWFTYTDSYTIYAFACK